MTLSVRNKQLLVFIVIQTKIAFSFTFCRKHKVQYQSFSTSDVQSCLGKEDKIVINIQSTVVFRDTLLPCYVAISTMKKLPPIM